MMRLLGAVLAMFLLVQAPPDKPPALTDVQKLQLQNLLQRVEIAQLKAQAAQRDFDAAREEINKLLGTLKVEGYTLDLQTLTYVKDPPPKKEP